jgi:hypothetical protein
MQTNEQRTYRKDFCPHVVHNWQDCTPVSYIPFSRLASKHDVCPPIEPQRRTFHHQLKTQIYVKWDVQHWDLGVWFSILKQPTLPGEAHQTKKKSLFFKFKIIKIEGIWNKMVWQV